MGTGLDLGKGRWCFSAGALVCFATDGSAVAVFALILETASPSMRRNHLPALGAPFVRATRRRMTLTGNLTESRPVQHARWRTEHLCVGPEGGRARHERISTDAYGGSRARGW